MKYPDPIAWEQSLPIRPSSPAWKATIRALYGTPLESDEAELFRSLAGREPPQGGADEFLAVVGRRGGKSETIARLACFEALHGGHAAALAPGQVGLIPVISPLREQSLEIVRYVHGLAALHEIRALVDGEPTRDGVRFRTGVEIRVMTADATNVSGPTIVTGIRDEFAKHPGADSAMPDTVTDAALRPALAPVLGAPRRRLLGITSAYIKDGLAYETDRDHYGRPDSDVLVVRGSTAVFNPAIDLAWLERERRRVGEAVFAREYLAEWQDAITEAWFGAEAIQRAVQTGKHELPYEAGLPIHVALDLSTSTNSNDKIGWAVASARKGDWDTATDTRGPRRTILHACGAWPVDRSPREIARRLRDEVCSRFRTKEIIIDQYSDQAFAELCRDVGLRPKIIPWRGGETGLDVSKKGEAERMPSKGDRYRSFRTAAASGDLLLCDNAELVADMRACRGILLPGGGERIEVPRTKRGHGDVLSAAVMAASQALISTARIPESDLRDHERFNRDNRVSIMMGYEQARGPHDANAGVYCGSTIRRIGDIK